MREKKAISAHTKTLADLKFLLVGPSGSGKTHLAGTYTGGPMHFYMFDPGGELTLQQAPNKSITYDSFVDTDLATPKAYAQFVQAWNKDDKEGFFKQLAAENGILVIDSLSTLAQAVLDQCIQKAGGDSKVEHISPQIWGEQMRFLKHIIREFNALPCCAIMTAHEELIQDKNTGAVRYFPLVTGKLRTQIGLYFSEVYTMSVAGNKRTVSFKSSGERPAQKTRIYKEDVGSIVNPTMDKIIESYMANPIPF